MTISCLATLPSTRLLAATLALAAATALRGLADITTPPSGITAWIEATGCEVIR